MSRITLTIRHPQRIPGAVLRRLMPDHPRVGNPWIRLPDGSVTFRDRGFVAAGSATELLARHNHETATIRRLLTGSCAARSLEIGCGFGRLTPTLAAYSLNHIAVDINRRAVRLAVNTYPGHRYAEASAIRLPFADSSFDLVTSWTVVQHIPQDQIGQACREILRVMKPLSTLLMCEETRFAERPTRHNAHTWHRTIGDYGRLLSPLHLTYAANIEELDRLPGYASPGTVMVWRRNV